MADLTRLDRHIQDRLNEVERRRKHREELQRQQMAEDLRRSRHYGKIADHLVQTIIQPRMMRLCPYFENVEFLSPELVSRYNCACRFRHTARFPVSTKLNLGVSHDARFEELLVLYDLEILPIPFPFEGHSELAFPVDAVEEDVVEAWVEEKIVYFVETYLRLGSDDGFPVLNMRCAPATAPYRSARIVAYHGRAASERA